MSRTWLMTLADDLEDSARKDPAQEDLARKKSRLREIMMTPRVLKKRERLEAVSLTKELKAAGYIQ